MRLPLCAHHVLRTLVTVALLALQVAAGEDFTVTTIAGQPGIGHRDGPKLNAMFHSPMGIAVAADGVIYVADNMNHVIRTIATDGTVSTLAGLPGAAGQVNGVGSAARFHYPIDIAIHPISGHLFVVESGHAILEIDPATGAVSTFVGSRGSAGSTDAGLGSSTFSSPRALCFDGSGTLYIADTMNHRIRAITPAGVVSTVAGNAAGYVDATGTAASFNRPSGIAVGSDGNLYVADTNNHRVRKVTLAGAVTTLAGSGSAGTADGTGTAATFNNPAGIARVGNDLYVNHAGRLRAITLAGVVTTYTNFAGSTLGKVAVRGSGTLLVSDTYAHLIRELLTQWSSTVFAGIADNKGTTDGPGDTARFANPSGIGAASDGTLTFIDGSNYTIRRMTAAGMVTTLAGTPGVWAHSDGTGPSAAFKSLVGLVVAADGTAYASDLSASVIRKITPAGVATTLAGFPNTSGFANGTGSVARFAIPLGLAIDGGGNIYVADAANRSIRKVTPAGEVTTYSGDPSRNFIDGNSSTAGYFYPQCVAVDPSTGVLYVADAYAIRRISTSGDVTTIAGKPFNFGSSDGVGDSARFHDITGLLVDGSGAVLVLDSGNSTLRKLIPSTGAVTTVAGLSQTIGSADGLGPAARFYALGGITAWNGSYYLTDSGNSTVRKATPPASSPGSGGGSSPGGSGGGGSAGGCGMGSAVGFLVMGLAACIPLRRRRSDHIPV